MFHCAKKELKVLPLVSSLYVVSVQRCVGSMYLTSYVTPFDRASVVKYRSVS